MKVLTIILFALALGGMAVLVTGAGADIQSGNSYFLALQSQVDTEKWAGLTIVNNALELSESASPFLTLLIDTPSVSEITFPGVNLKDERHYYAAMFDDEFNKINLQNITVADLGSNVTFNSDFYPDFYPDYFNSGENPNVTWCCNLTNVTVGGDNYTAFYVELPQNITAYLLKYNESGNVTPLFMTDFEDATCFNGTACVGQLFLPVTDAAPYNFFIINELRTYAYTIWIDGVETNTMSQVALPYNVSVRVRDLYTDENLSNAPVVIGERNGKTLFLPYSLSGYIRDMYTIGNTDGTGFESFLVAPTGYPDVDNYSIYVGVLEPDDDFISTPESLTVTTLDSLTQQSKQQTPTRLNDNARTNINAMNQIANFLFIWSSEREEAKSLDVTYEVNTDTWTIFNDVTLDATFELKTGAPNVLDITIEEGGVPTTDYYFRVQEEGGYLVMNPYTDTLPLTPTTKIARQIAETGDQIIVTPTELGSNPSVITFQILETDEDTVVGEINATIDSNLNIVTGGINYDNDLLKTIVNSVNQVLSSLFYSLNF